MSQEHLETLAKKQMSELMTKMEEARAAGNREQVQDLEKRYLALQDAVSDYQVSFEKLNMEAVQKAATVEGKTIAEPTNEETSLVKNFEEVTGIEVKEGVDIESLRQEAFQKLKAEASELTQQKNVLEKDINGLKKSSLEAANDKRLPADVLKSKEENLAQLKIRLQENRVQMGKVDDLADKIVFLKAKRDLMVDKDTKLTSAAEKSSEVRTSSVERKTSSGGSRRASSSSSGSGATLETSSMTGGGRRGGDRLEQVDLRVQDTGEREGYVETSDADEFAQNGPSNDEVATMLGTQSVFLETQSQANNLTQQAKKTDRQLKKMLAAVKAGNFEALTACMLLITKKFSNTVLNIGSKTITAMQYYDKQTADLTKQLSTIQGNDTRANARLSQVSLQMNSYSSNRSTIMNLLKEAMSAQEEGVSNLKSFLQKKEQITSRSL